MRGLEQTIGVGILILLFATFSPGCALAKDLHGTVEAVDGTWLHIAVNRPEGVCVGDRVTVAAEIPGVGSVPIPAEWRVRRIDGRSILAETEHKPAAQPQPGYRATIHTLDKKSNRSPMAAAQDAFHGKVIDVFENNVTVLMNSTSLYKPKDKIDISYVADTIEILIGQYEVVQSKGNGLIAKEISCSMPPSKGMKVRIVRSPVIEYFPAPDEQPSQKIAVNHYGEGITGAVDPRLEVSAPWGQQAKEDPFGIAKLDPNQWKEFTFEEYKQQLINEGKSTSHHFKTGQTSLVPNTRLGVLVKTNDSIMGQAFVASAMGLRVVGVTPGSAAEKSGLEVADIIYEVDNIKMASCDMFNKYILSAGNKIRLKIQRNWELLERTVILPNM